MIYLLYRLRFFIRSSYQRRLWRFSPEKQVLIGSIPALLTVLMLIELPVYSPLMFHLYLLDRKHYREDNRKHQI